MGKKVLLVGLEYHGEPIPEVEFENLGLCRPEVLRERAAFPLYEYDTIIINPASFSHFLFGLEGEHSGEPHELSALKKENEAYDFDTLFDDEDRVKEMVAAIAAGTNVVWCLSEPKKQNFFGYRSTHLGYVAPAVKTLVSRADLMVKKSRYLGDFDHDGPFVRYLDVLSKTGWSLCLAKQPEGFSPIASSPEGYSLAGRVNIGAVNGWLVTPPTTQDAADQLICDSVALEKADAKRENYHSIFLSHTSVDKPFVRKLRGDLLEHGVPRVWVDEAEIEIGDSLISKIDEGLKDCRFVGVIISEKSIKSPWVQKELEIAMTREIVGREVVVLPLVYEVCELPKFLEGKLYADFTNRDEYEEKLGKLLRRLRIK